MKALIIIILFPLPIFAQDITGLWTGIIHTTDKDLPYELAISESNGKLSGYSHTTFTVNGLPETGVKAVTIKNKNGNVSVEDEALIFNDYTEAPAKGVRQFDFLSLIVEDTAMMLNGTFKTNKTRQFRSVSGSIQLRKTDTSKTNKIIPKLIGLNLLNTLSFLQPKTKVKDDVAVTLKPGEKITSAQPITKDDEPTPVIIKQPLPIITSTKEAQTTSLATHNKPQVIIATKPKEIAASSLPKPIKNIQAVPVLKEQVKQIVMVPKPVPTKPAPVKKEQPVVAKQSAKVTVAPALPPVLEPAPVKSSIVSAAEVDKRKTETIQSVYFKSDSLVISLYDNGEVDGDTVSVILNGKVILANQGLTTNAITKTIYMTPDLGDSLQLVMYAENLGSIPPNTGLLILMDGNDRYEIRFAGDFKKNSAVILKRRH